MKASGALPTVVSKPVYHLFIYLFIYLSIYLAIYILKLVFLENHLSKSDQLLSFSTSFIVTESQKTAM